MSPSQCEWHRLEHGYLPPRLSQAEAIQETALTVDWFERRILRLVEEVYRQRSCRAAC